MFAGVAVPPVGGVSLGRVAAFTPCRCGSACPAALLPGSASGHPAPILIKAAARVGRCALRAALLDRVGAGRAYQRGSACPAGAYVRRSVPSTGPSTARPAADDGPPKGAGIPLHTLAARCCPPAGGLLSGPHYKRGVAPRGRVAPQRHRGVEGGTGWDAGLLGRQRSGQMAAALWAGCEE